MSRFADVVFPLPLPLAFTYELPEPLRGEASAGVRVRAPLGRKSEIGFIIGLHDRPPRAEAKAISAVLDPEPLLPPEILELALFLSRRFHSSAGELLQSALPPSRSLAATIMAGLTEKGRAEAAAGSLRGEEARVASLLAEKSYSLAFLKKTSRLADPAGAIARLLRKALIETRVKAPAAKPVVRPAEAPGPVQLALDFSADEAVERVAAAAASNARPGAAFVLLGPSERRAAAYLRLVRDAAARGRQVLLLCPEIGISQSLALAFEEKLGERAVLLHSRMTRLQREAALWRALAPETVVVAGPRSALFAPLPRLGLIIVEQEDDEAYRQEESPAYDARTGAVRRAGMRGASLVLGSEYPTVEAYHRAREDGRLIELAGGRAAAAAEVVDDRGERGVLARPVVERIGAALDAGRRIIVFVPRRGFASLLICPRCGQIPRCGRCGAPQALFRSPERLVCRVCGEERAVLRACENCGHRVLEPRSPGVEAAEEEIRRRFPKARIAGFDSDRAGRRADRSAILKRFESGTIDVLVGTALLAHQEGVAEAGLVAVLHPEHLLAFADYRAGQRMYAGIRRMARFAAGEGRGRIVLQTSVPDHRTVQAAARGDYRSFADEELERRSLMGYPPFAALAEISIPGRDPRALERRAGGLAERIRQAGQGVEVFGPAALDRSGRGGGGAHIMVRADGAARLDEVLDAALADFRGRVSILRSD